MAAKAGQRKGPPPRRQGDGRRRLWLVVFAAAFVALFVIFAVAQGIGSPSVPEGDAAIVEDTPAGTKALTEAEVKRATEQQINATTEGKGKKPKPGSKKYEELRDAALGELLDQIWIKGEAEELGISVTQKQIDTELESIKKTNFPTKKAYEEFLETTGFTQEDVNARVELQILSTEIQERIQSRTPSVTPGEIEAYYEAEKETQFTTPASRDVRLIVNKDKAKVEEAKKALEGDQSPANWKKVAKKYSSDPSTKSNGGLQKEITEEFVQGPLKKAIFRDPINTLSGPIEFQKNFFLIEPVKANPEKVKTLAEVRSQINQTLTQKKQEEYFSEFVSDYQSKWSSRTFCASDFLIERCSNYKGTGHPASAAPACYEENPKTPATECPAPVILNTPALPGSVTETEPNGQRLVQRPRPPTPSATGGSETSPGAGEK